MSVPRGFVFALVCLISPLPSYAAVVAVKIESRVDVLQGKAFGTAGAYEKIEGLVTFAFDPESIANEKIVDLNLAPRNMDGHVKATANFMVLQPKDPAKARGLGILEVSNRGGKALLPYFNAGVYTNNPEQEQDFGDGLLLRQGYTLMWVGWQWDVPPAAKALHLAVPIAKQGGVPISGLVRADWVLNQDETTLPLAHRNHQPYLATDLDHADNVMTERDERDAPRNVVPREQWHFVNKVEDGKTVGWSHVSKDGGFSASKIYEVVYRSLNPRVAGLGFAAVRDFMSFAKFDSGSPFRVRHGIAFGVSLTGRFYAIFCLRASTAMSWVARFLTACLFTPRARDAAASIIALRNRRGTAIAIRRLITRRICSLSPARRSLMQKPASPQACYQKAICRRFFIPTRVTNIGAVRRR